MNLSNMLVRRMQVQDLERVHEIDRLSFTLPWPKKSYIFELEQRDVAWCWVAEMFQPDQTALIVGMAVVWQVVEEAHIATIAVDPDFRNQGIGKKLMATILYHAKQAGMRSMTLEVRETNEIAQDMYLKFGFEVKGRRHRYYHDTKEDALIMTMNFHS
jgi:[ribosomal protein S18]-alanine N-acetyltransferase